MYSHFFTQIILRPTLLLTVLLCGVLSLVGSGGGGGDDDGTSQTGIIGISFTEANMRDAVSMGISPLTLFHPLSLMTARIIDALEFPIPPTTPFNLTGELCVSSGGTANLIWNDVTPSGISANDRVTLNFSDCDLDLQGDLLEPRAINGSITFLLIQYDNAATGVLTPYVSTQVTISLSIEEMINGTPSTQTVDGDLLGRVYRSSTDISTATWGFRYGDLSVNPDALLTFTESGTNAYKFGCFDVSLSLLPGNPFDYSMGDETLSHLYGIAVANDNLLTVTGTPPSSADLNFSSDILTGGSGLVYYGFVLGDGCAVIGVPDGVSTGGSAVMAVLPEPSTPGTVSVELYLTGFGTPPDVTLYESWENLY